MPDELLPVRPQSGRQDRSGQSGLLLEPGRWAAVDEASLDGASLPAELLSMRSEPEWTDRS